MSFILKPWQLLIILAAWVHRQQQQIIDFQNALIETLLKKLGKKRLLLSDDQRRVLAVKGKALGRKALMDLTPSLRQVRFCGGIGSWSQRSGITVSVAT